MKKAILFFTLAVYLGIPCLEAQAIDLAGARPLGMGGAFVAQADDPNAVFWNPAGMKQFSNNIVTTNINIRRLNEAPHGNFIIVNSKKDPLLDGGIGFGRHRALINGIDYEKTDIIFALADEYTKNFLIGVSGKYVEEKENDTHFGKSLTMDAGAIVKLTKTLKIGATGYNLTDPSLISYTRKLQLGVSWKVFDTITLAADGARLFSQESDDEYNYNLGAEMILGKYLVLRGGYSEEKIYGNRYTSGGFGLLTAKALIDYVYIHDLEDSTRRRHMVGVSYPF